LAHRQVVQARALLLAADGVANAEIARHCQTTTMSVRRWRARFAEARVDAIDDWTDHRNEHAAPFT